MAQEPGVEVAKLVIVGGKSGPIVRFPPVNVALRQAVIFPPSAT